MDLLGIGAIVSGGASGLGRAAAMALARGGAKVAVIDLAGEAASSLAQELGGIHVPADVTNESSVGQALDLAERTHGLSRILINCAGVATPIPLVAGDGQPTSMCDFSKVISINLLGTLGLVSNFAARLRGSPTIGEESGVVINTASVAAFDGQPGQVAYAASKGGIVAMGLPMARELAEFKIRVMTIAPGIFKTPLLAGLPREVQTSLEAQVPFPSRMGEPEEFAQLVMAIIANPMLNGETIRLDGAMRMGAT